MTMYRAVTFLRAMQFLFTISSLINLPSFISLIILWEKKVPHVSSSVFALVLGMCVSQANISFPVDFAPELFLYLMLPPMLLHSSFNFEIESLKLNWVGSLTFASLGTLFCVGWIAYGILVWSYYYELDISLPRALVYASVLAPTDTVATISLTRSMDIANPYIFNVLENSDIIWHICPQKGRS